MTQVPIIIRAPGLPSGSVSDRPAQHLDIAPTLARAAGGEQLSQWVGDPLQDAERTPESPIYYCLDDQHGVRKGEWKLIWHLEQDSEELFNVPHMGFEEEDLADENPAVLSELTSELDEHASWMGSNAVGEASAGLSERRDDLSEKVEQNLEELGYLES